mmetsp:Transcript_37660/g.93251  ORF Transcript_37660/g.93251 Transcript_37660/m.93251 type:complete len:118 (-) Transcript_37660:20-373(-)
MRTARPARQRDTRALEGREKQLGSSHPRTLATMYRLATLLRQAGRVEEAIPLFRRELEGLALQLGDEDEETLCSASNLLELIKPRDAEEARQLRTRFGLSVQGSTPLLGCFAQCLVM